MANEYSVNQSDLILVADAIRAKSETSESLIFPDGFVTSIEGIKGGGITVKAYESEDVLPSSAEDGEIVVISATSAGNVYVQKAEPTEANNGDLWVTFGLSGEYPSISGNVIIYLRDAYQYVDGVWTKVTILIWWNGMWNRTFAYLLNGPDKCDYITGGWRLLEIYTATVDVTENGFTLNGYNNGHQTAGIETIEKVDLTNYSKIVFKGEITSLEEYNQPCFCITDFEAGDASGLYSNVASVTLNRAGEYIVILDISSYTGSYYVGVGCGSVMTVTQIYME